MAQPGTRCGCSPRTPISWALLGQRPDLTPKAVEQVLRAEPITPFTARIRLEPVEHRGVLFRWARSWRWRQRGNREQAGGEESDITADRDGRLLTFGAGRLRLGVNLARAELEEALTFLAPRTPWPGPRRAGRAGRAGGHLRRRTLPLRWSASPPWTPG